ncbi:hypothetical protein MPTK1_1g02810 [Marchantia polymorpha subsp. ruderalis]|uniref:Uncharacterized protein n=2 Tax=Marchantia polymorpha TaxID=3197 RepID=A0AAF6AKV1_MARPO|nr:hypothetical protein MARPO_0113s0029 [Marchantia polymorpha]PTQ31293.1 hypothetical protein MARPO_0113s0029 [Marchantia polymorpha]BBM97070.1 hypothetical protein Mp_1g02810 [Marchantia polymorpha subsp. ruderalis]BBM97071.1 hypothetical protein Mp_1g02810 [Marchantia polymorpha subsp. ruderalis]|eukprot:PTQ31292.1 hypothetical protein MARPO_0113s0029 [Marchantia polymorpha]
MAPSASLKGSVGAGDLRIYDIASSSFVYGFNSMAEGHERGKAFPLDSHRRRKERISNGMLRSNGEFSLQGRVTPKLPYISIVFSGFVLMLLLTRGFRRQSSSGTLGNGDAFSH